MSVNINAANISSARFAGSAAPGTPASGFVQLYFDTSEDLTTLKDNGGGITIATSPGSGNYTLTIPATGTVALLGGAQTFTGKKQFDDDIVMANGKGIDFSANAHAAGMTSEILDDYEEGNWTPAYATTGVGFNSIAHDIQVGRYTKIGEYVTAWFTIRANGITVGSASGSVVISGLPFTPAIISNFYYAGSLGAADSFGTNTPSGIVTDQQTRAFLYYRDAADGATTSLLPGDLATGASSNLCYGTITYKV